MNWKSSAFVLTLVALLCFLPAAAALDSSSLPEDTAASMVQSAGTEDAAAAEDLPEPQEERPVLPENPPTMISYTTPEEIGFPVDEAEAASDVPEDAQEPAAPSEETVPSTADATVSPSAEQPAPAPVVSTLPQTGTSSALCSGLLSSGAVLLICGFCLSRRTLF